MSRTEPSVESLTSSYTFVRTPGREKVIAAFDNLLRVLRVRVHEHEEHGNRDLTGTTADMAQRVMIDLELFCRKWEESDRRGLTY
jgi:hypothetical protein